MKNNVDHFNFQTTLNLPLKISMNYIKFYLEN